MSSKRQRRRECERKVHHATREGAEAARFRTGRFNTFAESRKGLSVYPCPQGDGWLVGHKPGTANRAGLSKKGRGR